MRHFLTRHTMRRAVLFIVLLIFAGLRAAAQQTYEPRYWLEGGTDAWQKADEGTDAAVSRMCNEVYNKGWRGILFWGADRDGAKMRHYFKSPFLEKQSWSTFVRDGLTAR